MRNVKGKLQRENIACSSVGTRNSSGSLHIDRSKIVKQYKGKKVPTTVTMPRTRKPASNANTPSIGWSSVTSSNQISKEFTQTTGGHNQQRKRQEMESLLQKHNEVMPCMTGLDRVVNWKLSSECSDVYDYNKDLGDSMSETIRRSSIQERISYDKLLPISSIDHQSSNLNDFKVPATIQPNNSNNDINFFNSPTDEITESTKSTTTTSQEELYSYLGVVTKSQTSKPDTETKTVKRSSLRVKVKQIALRNQEKYNRLNSGKKEDSGNGTVNNERSIVPYGHRADVPITKGTKKDQLVAYETQANQSGNAHTKYGTKIESTNNQTNNKPIIRNSAQQSNNPLQMAVYSYNQSITRSTSTKTCTVMERYVYKRSHDADPIYVNHKKYKSTTLVQNTNTVIYTSNVLDNTPPPQPPTVSQKARNENEFIEHSYVKRIDTRSYKPNQPTSKPQVPRITTDLKRLAMEQLNALKNANRPTPSNAQCNIQSAPNRPHRTRSSTGVVIKPQPRHTQDIGFKVPSKQKNSQPNNRTDKVSTATTSSRQNINSKGSLQPRPLQNIGPSDKFPLTRNFQQNNVLSHEVNSRKNTESKNVSSLRTRSLQNIYPGNASSLPTNSQRNADTNNILLRGNVARRNADTNNAHLLHAHSLQNIGQSIASSSPTSSSIVGDNIVSSHDMKLRKNLKPSSLQNISTSNLVRVTTSSQKNISTKYVSSNEMSSPRSINVSTAQNIRTSKYVFLPASSQGNINVSSVQVIGKIKSVPLPTNSQRNIGTEKVSLHRKGSRQNINVASPQDIDTTNSLTLYTNSRQNIDTKMTSSPMSSKQNTKSSKDSSLPVHSLKDIETQAVGPTNVSSLPTTSQPKVNLIKVSSRQSIGTNSSESLPMGSQQNIDLIKVSSPQSIYTNSSVSLPMGSQQNIDLIKVSSPQSIYTNSSVSLPMGSQQNIDLIKISSLQSIGNNCSVSLPTGSQQNIDLIKVSSPQSIYTNSSVSLPMGSQQNINLIKVSSSQSIYTNSSVSLPMGSQQNIDLIKVSSLQSIGTNHSVSLPTGSQKNVDLIKVSSLQSIGINCSMSLPMASQQNVDLVRVSLQQSIGTNSIVSLPTGSQKNIDLIEVSSLQRIATSHTVPLATISQQNIDLNKESTVQVHPLENNEINNALSVSTTENVVHPSGISSKDLNENVPKINKTEISISPDTNDIVQCEAKREMKTNSIDDVKPNLTQSPISSEISTPTTDTAPEVYSNFKRTGTLENLDSNFIRKEDGELMSIISHVKHLVVIQERLISFWSLPSMLFSIFGMDEKYMCVGKKERSNCDIEIDAPYQYRLLTVGETASYVELRAKKLTGSYTRDCLTSIYLSVYSCDDKQEVTLRHIECDRFHGSIPSIRYIILPNSRSFVVSWTENIHNINRYNLNINMTNVESVLPFPAIHHPLKTLNFFEDDKVIGFGYSTITIWDSRTGDIILKIDMNLEIGENLAFFSLNENTERALILIQLFTSSNDNIQLIKLMAINMNDHLTWKVICTHEMKSYCAKIASSAIVNNHLITTYDNGQSFLLNLYNPKQFITCSSQTKDSKLFVIKDKVITINNNKMTVKTFVDHFCG